MFLKTVKQRELRGRARCDVLDLVLAEDVRAEVEIAVERDRNSDTLVVDNLHRLVRGAPRRVEHVRFFWEFRVALVA
ncbi:MAG TPA: hypothetical protein VHU80_05220 [Polyangiaceae bacterium]|nr:hypothetical protein [Polyangiaceae bacterium]